MKINYLPATYHIGQLAYVDTFAGLVKCKVTCIASNGQIECRITGKSPSYYLGTTYAFSPNHVIPRDKVHIRNHKYSIINNYAWASVV